ncbi:MAG: carbon-nitrogen hydrolase family protein, partial [Armatimonadetes bacterium]|nr:carbon-nitrogen hydrolase family protein [Armatimonadota bacterium]
MELRVAGAQIPVTRDVDANLALLEAAIEYAAHARADVLLTPEGSLSGYTHQFDAGEVEAGLRRIVSLASEAGVGLALGTCFAEREDERCYNQVRFYDAGGRFLGFHSKTLTCGTLTDPPEGETNHFATAPLRTFELNGVRVGALICNDLWANPGCTPQPDPHLTQQLSRMGARVIF